MNRNTRMSSAVVLEWMDAETPHAKVLRSDRVLTPASPRDDLDIQAAVERIERFQARVLREAEERPLVVVEPV